MRFNFSSAGAHSTASSTKYGPTARRKRERFLIAALIVILLFISLRPVLSPSSKPSLHQNSFHIPSEPIAEAHLSDQQQQNGGQQKSPEEQQAVFLREVQSTQERLAAASRKLLSQLRNGVDFTADYDLNAVQQPESYRTVGGSNAPSSTTGKNNNNNLPVSAAPPALKFRYMNETTSKYPFRWVSTKPRIALVPHFLSDAECDEVIRVATPALARSMVADQKNHGQSAVAKVRTSSQTWLSVTSEGIGKTIAERIYDLTSFPPGSSELLQVLRYEYDQKYDAHLDYFDPAMYGPQVSNRAMTVYLYLSDVEEGGHTWFPLADGKKEVVSDYIECKRGLAVKPTKGTAVVFYDMTPEGEYDPSSLHGSCPVKRGTKFGGTLWFRIPV